MTEDLMYYEGELYRKADGRKAGWERKDGYRTVYTGGKKYLSHRVIWFLCTGAWPKGVIDHIDGNPSNNDISNLRDCTQSENILNSRVSKSNKLGVKGVWFDNRTGKYAAETYLDGNKLWLGRFPTLEEATAAVSDVRYKHHNQFANNGDKDGKK